MGEILNEMAEGDLNLADLSTVDTSKTPSPEPPESSDAAVAEDQEDATTATVLPGEPSANLAWDSELQEAKISEPVTANASDQAEDIPAPVPVEKYQELLKEKEDLYNRLLRKQAEFENFRKRTEKEKQEFYDFALGTFIKDLLPIMDGLERSLFAPDGDTVENHKKGIELILKQFRDVLAIAGLQPIRATGRIFDPNFHQAVMREESSGLAENEIIEEFQRGYTFKERLIRPSMVKVAVLASQDASEEEPVEE